MIEIKFKMKIIGKVESKNNTKNNVFYIIKNDSDELIQLVLKKDPKECYQNQEINVGDVIKYDVIKCENNNSKYKFNRKPYVINLLCIVSRNIKNLKFYPNILAIKN